MNLQDNVGQNMHAAQVMDLEQKGETKNRCVVDVIFDLSYAVGEKEPIITDFAALNLGSNTKFMGIDHLNSFAKCASKYTTLYTVGKDKAGILKKEIQDATKTDCLIVSIDKNFNPRLEKAERDAQHFLGMRRDFVLFPHLKNWFRSGRVWLDCYFEKLKKKFDYLPDCNVSIDEIFSQYGPCVIIDLAIAAPYVRVEEEDLNNSGVNDCEKKVEAMRKFFLGGKFSKLVDDEMELFFKEHQNFRC